MGIESATYIGDLNEAWPLGSDGKNTLDNHARLTKAALKSTFPNLNAAVTPTAAQINAAVAGAGLSTVSSSTTSLSISVASKSLTVETGKGFAINQPIQLAYDLTNFMTGNVASYNSVTGAMTASISSVTGSGTYADWDVFVIPQAPPFSDANALVKNASDTSKMARLDASAIGTGVTRDFSFPNESGVFALSGGDNFVSVNAGNGHGSTNTKIRRYTTTVGSAGTAIVYADSAANGASFTISEPGIYAILTGDGINIGSSPFGVSLNSNELTTDIISIAASARLVSTLNIATTWNSATCVVRLLAGDVIRPHTAGDQDVTTAATSFFSIRKICS